MKDTPSAPSRKHKPALKTKECRTCCEPFMATPWSAYCSTRCRDKWWYEHRSRASCVDCGKRLGWAANDTRASTGQCQECRLHPCGTIAAYKRGCRCADCRRANVVAHNDYFGPRRHNWITPKARLAIYERDNWTCQLFGEPVNLQVNHLDPQAPSIDHIEPQSLALVPNHDPSNLRTAHRSCNSKRGNRLDWSA